MYTKVPTQLWMLLPREQRVHLTKVFHIDKTGITEIKDDQVVSDGHTHKDLEAITEDKMAEYVGSNESFPRLWELTVAKSKFELNPPMGLIVGQDDPDYEKKIQALKDKGYQVNILKEAETLPEIKTKKHAKTKASK